MGPLWDPSGQPAYGLTVTIWDPCQTRLHSPYGSHMGSPYGTHIGMFENHINEKVNKANSIMGVIRRTFEFRDIKTFKILYTALVRPHVEYANQVWNPHLKKHIDLLENVQRRATKSVPGLSKLTYEERLRKIGLPTLAYRRISGDMIETYKILSQKYDPEVIL